MAYQTRKHQIAMFLRELKLPPTYRRRVGRALRDAAMVGAAEERSRTLEVLREFTDMSCAVAAEKIVSGSVLAVLGYE